MKNIKFQCFTNTLASFNFKNEGSIGNTLSQIDNLQACYAIAVDNESKLLYACCENGTVVSLAMFKIRVMVPSIYRTLKPMSEAREYGKLRDGGMIYRALFCSRSPGNVRKPVNGCYRNVYSNFLTTLLSGLRKIK